MKIILFLLFPILALSQPQQDIRYYNNGLNIRCYIGSFNNLVDFTALRPVWQDTASNFTIPVSVTTENFALRFHGYINLPVEGSYTFFVKSDDGSAIYVDSMLIAWNDGLHMLQERSGVITLHAGLHYIEVPFFQKLGGVGLEVSYSGPGISKRLIPDSVLYTNDTTLFFMPVKFLVSDTIKDAVGNALTTSRPDMIEGYEVYKTVPGETYLVLIDRLDKQRNKLPKNYFIWLSK